ncbi:hypothetical protein AVEN_82713-1 [Araneus ventricosus]|uniref:Uncharacterized protein n=1 Tax=Araneus ventricosus TaxID=182803 RepID=A0A4Y2I5T8_ARAVE|nr:hypothetical protein AVEN_82713-1 [Araneus ventricosus]
MKRDIVRSWKVRCGQGWSIPDVTILSAAGLNSKDGFCLDCRVTPQSKIFWSSRTWLSKSSQESNKKCHDKTERGETSWKTTEINEYSRTSITRADWDRRNHFG